MSNKNFSPIKEILMEAKKGKMFILVDDKDRENEGDLVIPASKCNSKIINFMATHGKGLICLALTKTKVDKLGLPLCLRLIKQECKLHLQYRLRLEKGLQQEFLRLIELRQLELQ